MVNEIDTVQVESKDRFYLIYYIVLLGGLLLLTHPNASYSILIRFAYLGMLVIPLFFNPRFTPFVITCFYGTCKNACYSLLPESFEFCIAIVLVLFFLHLKKLNFRYGEIKFLLIFFVYSFFISLFNSDLQQNFLSVGLVAILLFPFIKDEEDVKLLAVGFCLMSFVLAIMYFQNFSYYSFSVGKEDEFERGTWQNMNVLAGAIGCGLPLSLALLLNVIKGYKPKTLRIFLVANVVLLLFTLATLSSRGALIAAATSSVLLILFSKIKTRYKLLIIIGMAFLALFMVFNGFFDLFIYRMTEESSSETGGGRTIIWQSKLNPFFQDTFSTQIFGMGREKCVNYGVYYSTHNDFVTAIVGFGFVGLLLMVLFVLSPMFKARKQNFIPIGALVLFMVLECMVLEPFYRGYLPYWMFYVLLMKLVTVQRQSQLS